MLTLCSVLCLALSGACDKLPSRPKTAFNADSAFSYTRQQVAFGPRVPGTPGAVKAGDWIVAMMKARADTVIEQRWTHKTLKGDSLPLRNILARFNPKATQRVLYITHWDTRPVADSDPVLGNRNTPILGANDGAAGVGLFVALGDALKKVPATVGVDLLFVDGEDYGTSFDPPYADVLLGSQYFANHLPTADYKPIYGVLWDMIGDAYLDITQEPNSVRAAPEVAVGLREDRDHPRPVDAQPHPARRCRAHVLRRLRRVDGHPAADLGGRRLAARAVGRAVHAQGRHAGRRREEGRRGRGHRDLGLQPRRQQPRRNAGHNPCAAVGGRRRE